MLPKPDFTIGDGATMIGWTDREAYSIIAINPSRKTVTIQRDIATRSDTHGMSDAQSYTFDRNPHGSISVVTLRKDGFYRVRGGTTKVLLGQRSEYYDYSF
jgi:hypothetical protein